MPDWVGDAATGFHASQFPRPHFQPMPHFLGCNGILCIAEHDNIVYNKYSLVLYPKFFVDSSNMREILPFIQENRSGAPWPHRLLRALLVAGLVAAFGLAGSALSEYRLLHAVAALPDTASVQVLTLDCPTATASAQTGPEVIAAGDTLTAPFPLTLQGFRCTITLTPD